VEILCIHERWIVLVEGDEWVHVDDDEGCTPLETLPVTYLDEAS
jgi:hypothetical protein